jgi:hypothetical protein
LNGHFENLLLETSKSPLSNPKNKNKNQKQNKTKQKTGFSAHETYAMDLQEIQVIAQARAVLVKKWILTQLFII